MSERIFVAQKTKQTGKPVQSLAKVDFTNLENKSSKKLNISIKQKITSNRLPFKDYRKNGPKITWSNYY